MTPTCSKRGVLVKGAKNILRPKIFYPAIPIYWEWLGVSCRAGQRVVKGAKNILRPKIFYHARQLTPSHSQYMVKYFAAKNILLNGDPDLLKEGCAALTYGMVGV